MAAESARLYAESPGAWRFVGVASVAEEISFAGAHTSAFSIAPQAAIAIDVTHTADYPSVTKNKIGDIRIGGGPVIERGSGVHPAFAEMVAEESGKGAFRMFTTRESAVEWLEEIGD